MTGGGTSGIVEVAELLVLHLVAAELLVLQPVAVVVEELLVLHLLDQIWQLLCWIILRFTEATC
eukprot:8031172-Prorocentrum_lima.AAC.1